MSKFLRRAIPLALIVVLSACSKSNQEAGLPLSYAPADTPYLFANAEPFPQALVDEYMASMKPILPLSFGMYERLISEAKDLDDNSRKIASAVLAELRTAVESGSGASLGFSAQKHFAAYGIGLVPVLRAELADPAALRAAIARVEAKAGAKLPVAKIGEQEYWHVGDDKMQAIAAIIGQQLVITLAPTAANDDLRKQFLGLTPPAQRYADSGKLAALNDENKFLPYGTFLFDVVRTADLATQPDATQKAFMAAMGAPEKPVDAVCRGEILEIAKKFPRVLAGYTEAQSKKMAVAVRLDLEPGLAKDVAAVATPAPGTGAPAEGLMDISIALPVLKFKDFWIKQTKAVVDKPFACADLASLNQDFKEMNEKLATTIPPPVSDLTGARVVLTKLSLDAALAGGKPDITGKLVIGLSNPMSALAMGQLAVPQLKDVKIAPDGKPVALPAGLLPDKTPPISMAMSDKAVAASAGAGEEATLGAFLAAPAAAEPAFMRMYFTGSMYSQFGGWMGKMRDLMPEPQKAMIDDQVKLFQFYEKWLRNVEITLKATPKGVELVERFETN